MQSWTKRCSCRRPGLAVGVSRGKLLSPERRRRAVCVLQDRFRGSQHRASVCGSEPQHLVLALPVTGINEQKLRRRIRTRTGVMFVGVGDGPLNLAVLDRELQECASTGGRRRNVLSRPQAIILRSEREPYELSTHPRSDRLDLPHDGRPSSFSTLSISTAAYALTSESAGAAGLLR